MIEDKTYRDNEVTIADIEIMFSCSFRTAQRKLAKIKQKLGIPKYKRPTFEQVKSCSLKIA